MPSRRRPRTRRAGRTGAKTTRSTPAKLSRSGRPSNRKAVPRDERKSRRSREARLRGFAAINLVRRGKAKSLTSAAKTEGTTLRTIRQLLPAALMQDRPGGRVRVKAGDPYSERVEILTDLGALEVKARGSRERGLAGRHRSVYLKVLRGDLPPSALEEFRGKTVGGHGLISDPDRLFALAKGGELDQLDELYVSPETRG